MNFSSCISSGMGALFPRVVFNKLRNFTLRFRVLCIVLLSLLSNGGFSTAQAPPNSSPMPHPEKLAYHVEWRLITAGLVKLDLLRAPANGWQLNLDLESAGLVTKLYKVLDSYKAVSDDQFCGVSSVLDAQEGKRHRVTRLSFHRERKKVDYQERDLIKNTTVQKELDIPICTHEILGALSALRSLDLQPGKSVTIPVTDGKKLANVKVDALARESVNASGKNYQAIRYEVFVFDNILYTRKGRLFLWMTDDAERLPVQFRVQLGFPIGTILLQLDKHEKL
jgi:hypothetical protein